MPQVTPRPGGRRDWSWVLSTIVVFLPVCGLSLLLFGCNGPKKTWSAESRSPDGKMIATAETIVASGIGTGDVGTRVYLNWSTGSQPETIIVAFAEGPDEPGGHDVRMTWLTPTHLEVSYGGHRALDFQAVKCHGIDISVRELETRNSSPQ
jgi:hypothetical protein